MVVGFVQFRQIEAGKGLGLLQGLGRWTVQQRWQLQPQLLHHIAVVIGGVVKPLLAVREAVAPLIHGDQRVWRQVLEQ